MKFVIEVDDFWSETDGESGEVLIAKELKGHIVNSIVYKIREEIKDKVSSQIELKAKEEIASKIEVQVDYTISEFLRAGKVFGRYTSDEKITFSEHIEKVIEEKDIVRKIEGTLQRMLDTKTTELVDSFKERYDAAFASQIVHKLNANGFLKDGVIDLLIQK